MRFQLFCIATVLTACSPQNQNIVATIDGKPITMQQIDAMARNQLFSMLESIYQIRHNVLDEYINQLVINIEAENKELSYNDYLELNVYSKITDSLVDDKAEKLGGYVPDRTDFTRRYDCSTTFGRAYLVESLCRQMVSDLADSLRKHHSINIMLQSPEPMRPRADLSKLKISHKGNLNAEKSIVLVGSYACDGCKAAWPLFNELFELYGTKLKFGFCFYEGVPSVASLAAKAAERQGEFWPMHYTLMAAETEIDTAFVIN